jgi:hypothetical protein
MGIRPVVRRPVADVRVAVEHLKVLPQLSTMVSHP